MQTPTMHQNAMAEHFGSWFHFIKFNIFHSAHADHFSISVIMVSVIEIEKQIGNTWLTTWSPPQVVSNTNANNCVFQVLSKCNAQWKCKTAMAEHFWSWFHFLKIQPKFVWRNHLSTLEQPCETHNSILGKTLTRQTSAKFSATKKCSASSRERQATKGEALDAPPLVRLGLSLGGLGQFCRVAPLEKPPPA